MSSKCVLTTCEVAQLVLVLVERRLRTWQHWFSPKDTYMATLVLTERCTYMATLVITERYTYMAALKIYIHGNTRLVLTGRCTYMATLVLAAKRCMYMATLPLVLAARRCTYRAALVLAERYSHSLLQGVV